MTNGGRLTSAVSWTNNTGSAVVAGELIASNGFAFVAYENIAKGATGTVIIPVSQEAKLTLKAGDAAGFGACLFKESGAQTLTITGTSVSDFVGRSLASVSSVSAAQSIDVALYSGKTSYTV